MPMSQIHPAVPPTLAQAAHQLAHTDTQPVYSSASTRMNMLNAKGSSGSGRREMMEHTVGRRWRMMAMGW